MKASELTVADLASYLKIESDDLDDVETAMLQSFLDAAWEYAKSYTGQTEEYLDGKNEVAIAALCLAGDMYTNRDMYTNLKGTGTATVNRTVQTILDMHSKNQIPEVSDVST